jgi:putative ATPase
MIEGGEDARFIVRRMVILASEDIGNADPQALVVATAAAQAVEHVGMPEATYALAQAAVYLALAPKSNAAGKALGAARQWIREHGAPEIPMHLRYPGHPGEKSQLGHGEGYDYPHDRPNALSEQEYLPADAAGTRFLDLTKFGFEGELRERYERILRGRGRSAE